MSSEQKTLGVRPINELSWVGQAVLSPPQGATPRGAPGGRAIRCLRRSLTNQSLLELAASLGHIRALQNRRNYADPPGTCTQDLFQVLKRDSPDRKPRHGHV